MREAITKLELPAPNKRVKKLISKTSKELAAEFSDLLKKQGRKAKARTQELTYVEDVLKGKSERKPKKSRIA